MVRRLVEAAEDDPRLGAVASTVIDRKQPTRSGLMRRRHVPGWHVQAGDAGRSDP